MVDNKIYISGKMACLVALAALDTFGGARFRTLFGVVAFLLAVLTGVGVDALFGAIASSVTFLQAVHTLNSRCHSGLLRLLLLAVLEMFSIL